MRRGIPPRGGARAVGAALLLVLPAPSRAADGLTGFVQVGPEVLGAEYLAALEPGLSWESARLEARVAAPLRLRLGPGAGRLRAEDWDDLSDAGRLLQLLEFSAGERTVVAKFGALAHQSVGHGTIVAGYGDCLDPDRMPLGAAVRLAAGPAAADLLASDILGPGLLGGAVAVEPLFWIERADRLRLSASAFVDRGAPTLADGPSAAVYGLGLDLAAWRGPTLRLSPYADVNGRGAGWGVHAGLLADLSLGGAELSFKGEWRRVKSPYQPEYFDLAYGVERWDVGGEATPRPKRDIHGPTASLYRVEARVRSGGLAAAAAASSRAPGVHDLSAVASARFADFDLAGFAAARPEFGGDWPGRVYLAAEARWRFAGYFYVWALAGRLYRAGDGGQVALPATRLGTGLGAAASL